MRIMGVLVDGGGRVVGRDLVRGAGSAITCKQEVVVEVNTKYIVYSI